MDSIRILREEIEKLLEKVDDLACTYYTQKWHGERNSEEITGLRHDVDSLFDKYRTVNAPKVKPYLDLRKKVDEKLQVFEITLRAMRSEIDNLWARTKTHSHYKDMERALKDIETRLAFLERAHGRKSDGG